MKVEASEVAEGMLNGRTLWICDYRYNDIADKPIRAIVPTKVVVKSNTELPKNKSIYYSDSHFVKMCGEKETSTIIPLFDNTGYRSRTGTPLNIFTEEDECKKFFNMQLNKANEEVAVWLESMKRRASEMLEKHKKLKQC